MTVVREPTTCTKKRPSTCIYVYSHPQPPAHNDIHANGNNMCLTVSTKH